MVVEMVASWLVVQAVKLVLAPTAEATREAFANDIGKRLGSGAARTVSDWVARLSTSSSDDVAQVRLEMSADPETGSAVRDALEGYLGVSLSDGSQVLGGDPRADADAALVDAYAAALWRLASLSRLSARPIAVAGALQGPGWLTVVSPGPGSLALGGTPSTGRGVVNPTDLWSRSDAYALDRPLFHPPCEFYVRRADPVERGDELEQLNRRFRRNRNEWFSPNRDDPVETRWHHLDAVRPTWVRLEPDSNAYVHIVLGRGTEQKDLTLDPPEFDDYPSSWRELMELPDDLSGLAAMNAGMDQFVADDHQLRRVLEQLAQQ